uniref:Uncharacterized protein n=1 Tax=Physcomitrium patens TaxID=3218 RepID=A0A2K1JV81_PHYPA|nr:hypothetical protein PHYPA_015197 [Physcomitrium patens]
MKKLLTNATNSRFCRVPLIRFFTSTLLRLQIRPLFALWDDVVTLVGRKESVKHFRSAQKLARNYSWMFSEMERKKIPTIETSHLGSSDMRRSSELLHSAAFWVTLG